MILAPRLKLIGVKCWTRDIFKESCIGSYPLWQAGSAQELPKFLFRIVCGQPVNPTMDWDAQPESYWICLVSNFCSAIRRAPCNFLACLVCCPPASVCS